MEKIEPALTPHEWEDALDPDVRDGLAHEKSYLWGRARPHAAIAILNAALPDSDPRKITRETVKMLRALAVWQRSLTPAVTHIAIASGERTKGEMRAFTGTAAADINQIADALESYLPPEK